MIKLSNDQENVRQQLNDWVIDRVKRKKFLSVRDSYTTVGGYAGTGKTVLICKLIEKLKDSKLDIVCATYTGKASSILTKKLEDFGLINNVSFIGTIHSLMYHPKYSIHPQTRQKIIVGWVRKKELHHDLIIIDESSMVSSSIFYDLNQYSMPIIYFGDHGQLPPIEKDTSIKSFNLMGKPTYKLETIHRQSLDNPIIKLSIQAREKGFIENGIYSSNVFKLNWLDKRTRDLFDEIEFKEDTIALCGFNKTRVEINSHIRNRIGYTKNFPYANERMICLKNNSMSKIMNGQLGSLSWMLPKNKKIYSATIKMDDRDEFYSTNLSKSVFGKVNYDIIWKEVSSKKFKEKYLDVGETADYFDFGYTISVHKSQGSEWDRVVVFEQRAHMWGDSYWKRWLYTAVTRAREKLFIISNYF